MLVENAIPSQIDMTQPCQYPVAVGIEKGYIPDSNLWATSITNQARGPQYARLRGWKGKLIQCYITADYLCIEPLTTIFVIEI